MWSRASGTPALAAAAEFQPQVAILDIGQPGLSGYAVAERLRERSDAEPLVLIALPAWDKSRIKRGPRKPVSIIISPSRWMYTR